MKMLTCVTVALLVCFSALDASAQLIFDDGGYHVIDTNLETEDIIVRNAATGRSTTVVLAAGGRIESAQVFGRSRFNVTGGQVDFRITSFENSQVNMASGQAEEFFARDSSIFRMFEGSFSAEDNFVQDSAHFIMFGGAMETLDVQDGARATIHGASFLESVFLEDYARATILDVDRLVSFVIARDDSRAFILGGNVIDDLARPDFRRDKRDESMCLVQASTSRSARSQTCQESSQGTCLTARLLKRISRGKT